jgi:hypothetical protein
MCAALAITIAGTAWAAEKFVIALPNGYEMSRVKSGEPAIMKRKGRSVVVPAPIKAYVVIHDVVTGCMQTPEPTATHAQSADVMPSAPAAAGKPAAPADEPASPVFAPPPPDPNGRYFVLDTSTGEVGNDLSEADWEERLRKLGIMAPPQLAPPILPR